jgi:hypothetical protein
VSRTISRRPFLALVLAASVLPGTAYGQRRGASPIIDSYHDFRTYLISATRVVRELTAGIREAHTSRRLSVDEQTALAHMLADFEEVLGGQQRNADFLMDYIDAARTGSESHDDLAARWSEAGRRLTRTSQALSQVMRTARNTPAFASMVDDDVYAEFFTLTNARVGIMARLIELPMPQSAEQLASLEETIASWRELISASRDLSDEIGRALAV